MSEKAVSSTVENLKWIYAVVIALSIGEAFIQAVLPPESKIPGIQWDRLPSLCSFLLLVVPFYHGMSRFFYEMYVTNAKHVGRYYGFWLLFDCFVFTVEAGLFFVLARSLPKDLWWRFSWTIVALLLLDIAWGSLVWKLRSHVISQWVIVNLCVAVCLSLGILACRNSNPRYAISVVTLVLLARAAADYYTNWKFYFPNVAWSHSDKDSGQ